MSNYVFTEIFPVLAQNTKSIESTVTIIMQVGTVIVALISFVFSILSRRKQIDDKAQAEELKRYTDNAISALSPIVSRLDQADKFRENSITEFKRITEESLKQLNEAVKHVSGQCLRQQHIAQSETIAEIKKELQRLSNRVTRLDETFRDYQDTAGDRYIAAAIYYRDLKTWSDTFTEVKTSLRDLTSILIRMLEAGKN